MLSGVRCRSAGCDGFVLQRQEEGFALLLINIIIIASFQMRQHLLH